MQRLVVAGVLGLGNNGLTIQYTTTTFTFSPQATSFAGELSPEG